MVDSMPTMELPKTYWGARITSDAMDCELPMSIDCRSGCTHGCLYCFSNSLMREPSRNVKKKNQLDKFGVSQTEFNLDSFKKLMEGKLHNSWARVMVPLIKAGMPIQIGALGEPFDAFEPHTKWMQNAIPWLAEHNIPTRISTKGGTVLNRDEYMDLFKGTKNFWVAFSIITIDDELAAKIEPHTPSPSERFEAMRRLHRLGVKVSLRYRPIIPPVAMRDWHGKPEYQAMVDKAMDCGADALSYEVIFLNQMANAMQRKLYTKMFEAIGAPEFSKEWKFQSIKNQACLRANRFYKRNLMMSIRNYAKNKGIEVGISDPHFKEYGDNGCCCGIRRTDPVFGKYSTSMTDIVIMGRKHFEQTGENMRFTFTDWAPLWGKHIGYNNMCNVGDAVKKRVTMNVTWYDNIREKWNSPSFMRSPMNYFEGILQPVGVDKHNDVIYEYRDWERQIWQRPLPPLDVELTAKAKRESMTQEITLDELRQLRRIGFENDAD